MHMYFIDVNRHVRVHLTPSSIASRLIVADIFYTQIAKFASVHTRQFYT